MVRGRSATGRDDLALNLQQARRSRSSSRTVTGSCTPLCPHRMRTATCTFSAASRKAAEEDDMLSERCQELVRLSCSLGRRTLQRSSCSSRSQRGARGRSGGPARWWRANEQRIENGSGQLACAPLFQNATNLYHTRREHRVTTAATTLNRWHVIRSTGRGGCRRGRRRRVRRARVCLGVAGTGGLPCAAHRVLRIC